MDFTDDGDSCSMQKEEKEVNSTVGQNKVSKTGKYAKCIPNIIVYFIFIILIESFLTVCSSMLNIFIYQERYIF